MAAGYYKQYTSEYPEIVMDSDTNSVNGGMIVQLTVEQYYDLLHHTHKVTEFVDTEGNKVQALYTPIEEGGESNSGSLDQQVINMVTDLNNKVNELSQQVEKQQEMIEKQNDIIKTLSENAGVGDSSGIEVLDWDATTPEVDTAP